jgi:hypothetical protein
VTRTSLKEWFAHLCSLIKPSINSPNFKTYSLSLLLRASTICGSTSLRRELKSSGLPGSLFCESEATRVGESDSREGYGELEIGLYMGMASEFELELEPIFKATMGNEGGGEGEGMREMGADAGKRMGGSVVIKAICVQINGLNKHGRRPGNKARQHPQMNLTYRATLTG